MNISMTNELPTSGQFVMVNEFQGKIWGETYRYQDGNLEALGLVSTDVWSVIENFDEVHADITILGYVVEEA